MSLTREAVQAFIDGYIKAGGDARRSKRISAIGWPIHPLYPPPAEIQAVILEDLDS